MTPEFSRPIRLDVLAASRRQSITASAEECLALARRFGLLSIESFAAKVTLDGDANRIDMAGTLTALLTQSCVASGLPVKAQIETPIMVRIVPETDVDEEEIELSEEDCDLIEHDGQLIDIGEIVAQTLALALDPWPRHPDAEAKLAEAGVVSPSDVGPFAALKALKDKLS